MALKGRIVLIDALRGLAALVVFVHHVLVFFEPTLVAWAGPGPVKALEFIGNLNAEAVMLFFVLSGFSIRLSTRKIDMGTRHGVNYYLYRRFRRILPLYWLALALSAAAALVATPVNNSFSLRALIGNLLFLQTAASNPGNWFPPFAQNGPLWSLSYEMFYYLLFPLVCSLVSGRRSRLALALGLSMAGLAVNQLLPNPIAQFTALYLVWYLGVELAELHLEGTATVPWWCYTLLLAGFVALLSVRSSATAYCLAVGLVFMHLGLAAHALRGRVNADGSLVLRGLAKVGDFSYALYLLHYPLLRVACELDPDRGVATLLCVVTLSLAVSFVSETLLIRPRYAFFARAYLGSGVTGR